MLSALPFLTSELCLFTSFCLLGMIKEKNKYAMTLFVPNFQQQLETFFTQEKIQTKIYRPCDLLRHLTQAIPPYSLFMCQDKKLCFRAFICSCIKMNFEGTPKNLCTRQQMGLTYNLDWVQGCVCRSGPSVGAVGDSCLRKS